MDRLDEVITYFAQLCAVFEAFGATRIQKLRTSDQPIGDTAVKAAAIVNFSRRSIYQKRIFERRIRSARKCS
ncbi:MAG: hypothetical protein ACI9ND_003048 [Yoonia sp.]|jgi:hypothetical protein